MAAGERDGGTTGTDGKEINQGSVGVQQVELETRITRIPPRIPKHATRFHRDITGSITLGPTAARQTSGCGRKTIVDRPRRPGSDRPPLRAKDLQQALRR